MWRWADVKMRRYEDKKMWRWADVKMSRCEDEKMWRWEDVKMRRCEDEKMWRWEDVKMSRCEDEKMWRWEDVREGVKMRRCEDEKVRRWEDEIQTPTIGRTLRSDALGKKTVRAQSAMQDEVWKCCNSIGTAIRLFTLLFFCTRSRVYSRDICKRKMVAKLTATTMAPKTKILSATVNC